MRGKGLAILHSTLEAFLVFAHIRVLLKLSWSVDTIIVLSNYVTLVTKFVYTLVSLKLTAL